jgi:hypothetical protein
LHLDGEHDQEDLRKLWSRFAADGDSTETESDLRPAGAAKGRGAASESLNQVLSRLARYALLIAPQT